MSEFRICPILLRIGINLKTTEIAKDDVFKQTKSEVPSKLGNRKYKENLINKKTNQHGVWRALHYTSKIKVSNEPQISSL